MNKLIMRYIASVFVIFISLYMAIIVRKPLIDICEVEKCPFCYGDNLCVQFASQQITLSFNSVRDFLFNLLSVKNVYVANYNGDNVILKKLGHTSQLKMFDEGNAEIPAAKDKVLQYLGRPGQNHAIKHFSVCDSRTAQQFLASVTPKYSWPQIWFMLQVSVEPLLIELFRSGDWPFPKLYGACGRLVVERDCGINLNNFEWADWHLRAHFAVQLLDVALNLTQNHADFRLYLTDISPDNIVVDNGNKLHFVDLENAILSGKTSGYAGVHRTDHVEDINYVYFENDICQASVSDHNLYAVCWLLLSQKAPWPMMQGGLLHSAPDYVKNRHKSVLDLVEECVNPRQEISRFDIVLNLIKLLKNIVINNAK